jgi:hypothetical protein
MSAPTVFSPKVLLGLTATVSAAFALSIYLLAFGSGDTPRNAVGPSAYSRSAIGYAGLAELLRQVAIPVTNARSGDVVSRSGKLLILAEPHLVTAQELARYAFGDAERVLVILPKWHGYRSASHSGWISEATLLPIAFSDQTIEKAGATGKAARVARPERWTTDMLGVTPQLELLVQVIQDTKLTPIVAAGNQVLVGERADRNRRIWILSDPDMVSNHGLFRGRNAEFAIRLVNALRPARGEVIFDEEVHGYRAPSSNLLALMLQFPFVIVTIQLLAASALLLWATMPRFGLALPAPEMLAAGKQGLIRNAAILLRYSRHPEIIIASYLRSTIRSVARELRSPPGLDWPGMIEWLARVGASRGVAVDLRHLVRRAEDLVASGPGNVRTPAKIAHDAHCWKREMLHGP